jgi:hypothetical protein
VIRRHQHGLLSAILILVGITFLGCSSSNREERRWTEEVQLEDGSTVHIERYVAFDATNAMGGGAYNAVETKATLKFTGELASLPAWDFPRAALVLYRSIKTGNWVVVSMSSSCQVWRREGKPKPPYWQSELVEGQWKQVPVSPKSIGKKTNLFYSYWENDFPRHVTSQITNSRQSDPAIVEKYRHVAQQPKDFNCIGQS